MIKNKNDYSNYLEADRVSLSKTSSLKSLLFDDIWRFQKTLRKLEYLTNCKGNKLYRLLVTLSYRRQQRKLGFTIPTNVFGPGLSIAHRGTIVVNSDARIGANCRLHVCTNIGTAAGESSAAPKIGDNCYIGPGAKIFGSIEIGDNVAIAANAVVNKSIHESSITIGGIPAKKISQKGSEGLLILGYKNSSQIQALGRNKATPLDEAA
jgi:serine O-acetyltransferase